MPHPRCSVCKHPDLTAIDTALKGGESIRKLARRFGLSHGAVGRHALEADHAKTRINIGQIAHIDEEIKKLNRAQNKAKRKRDTAQVLAISRELRNWFVLRGKAELITGAIQSTQDATLSRGEALALAHGLIESEAATGSQELRSWLVALLERIDAARKAENDA